MDFTMIGTIGSYVKQKNLNFAAHYKIKTGQRVVDSNGHLQFAKSNMFDQMTKAQKKTDSEVNAARLSSIKQKLKNGRKLTTEEMSYLREKDPKTYRKAKHAEQAREELKGELKKAKTKQEARQAVTQAMIKASAEASAELAAYKGAMSAGGGGVAAAGFQAGTEVGGNVAGVETSAENLNGADSPSLIQLNEQISEDGEEMTGAAAEVTKLEIQNNQESAENLQQADEKNSELQQVENSQQTKENSAENNSDSSKKNTADDILEKFIMTIRALEDEWAQFTKSKEYNDLPSDYSEEKELEKIGDKKHKNNYKPIDAPSKKILDVISVYRNAMLA